MELYKNVMTKLKNIFIFLYSQVIYHLYHCAIRIYDKNIKLKGKYYCDGATQL